MIDVTPALNGSWFWGAAAIVSIGRRRHEVLRVPVGGHVLPANLLAAMKTITPRSPDGYRYGLGLTRVQTRCGTAYGHIGDFTAYRNVALAKSNGKRVVDVMVNVDETDVSWGELKATRKSRSVSAEHPLRAMAPRDETGMRDKQLGLPL